MISGRCELNLETVNRFFNQTNLWYNNNVGKYLGKNLQLKENFTADDVVVVLLHDSGSRYIGKMYNDDWMIEKGFLDN